MAEAIAFPYITPSKRVYTAGTYPTKFFESVNGTTTAIRFGNRRSKSKLQLTFEGVQEKWAYEILQCYEKTMENWDYIRFNKGDDLNDPDLNRGGAWEGILDQDLIENWYQENFTKASMTYWRFEGPPQVTHLYLGTVTVTCSFISYLDPQ